MSDLISRKALIDILAKYKFGAIKSESEREYTKETVLNFVKEQSSVTDTNVGSKWIPCSERLPKIEGYTSDTVLVCCSNGFQYMAFWCNDGQWRFCECGTAKEPVLWTNIIAWMPLPEPYKGEQHETD